MAVQIFLNDWRHSIRKVLGELGLIIEARTW